MKTPLGYDYTEKTIDELRKLSPNAVAQGKGREYFEALLDGVILADKITKGLPPSSPEEAKQMDIARVGVRLFDARDTPTTDTLQ
jgi:hypothetical protein